MNYRCGRRCRGRIFGTGEGVGALVRGKAKTGGYVQKLFLQKGMVHNAFAGRCSVFCAICGLRCFGRGSNRISKKYSGWLCSTLDIGTNRIEGGGRIEIVVIEESFKFGTVALEDSIHW